MQWWDYCFNQRDLKTNFNNMLQIYVLENQSMSHIFSKNNKHFIRIKTKNENYSWTETKQSYVIRSLPLSPKKWLYCFDCISWSKIRMKQKEKESDWPILEDQSTEFGVKQNTQRTHFYRARLIWKQDVFVREDFKS